MKKKYPFEYLKPLITLCGVIFLLVTALLVIMFFVVSAFAGPKATEFYTAAQRQTDINAYAATCQNAVETGYWQSELWRKAYNGAAISRTAYPELFEVLGTAYGAGDGVNTFNLPDFRGKFLRGVGGNSAAIGVAQGDGNKFHRHVVSCTDGAGSITAGLLSFNSYNNNIRVIPMAGLTLCSGSQTAQSGEYQADAVGEVESRPVNTAVKYCIIYE